MEDFGLHLMEDVGLLLGVLDRDPLARTMDMLVLPLLSIIICRRLDSLVVLRMVALPMLRHLLRRLVVLDTRVVLQAASTGKFMNQLVNLIHGVLSLDIGPCTQTRRPSKPATG